MRMQLDTTQVHDPKQTCNVIDHQFLGGLARWERERYAADPLRARFRRALLVKRCGFCAIDEALEHDWAPGDATQGALRDARVVLDQLQLRELQLLGEVELLRVRDAQFATRDREPD